MLNKIGLSVFKTLIFLALINEKLNVITPHLTRFICRTHTQEPANGRTALFSKLHPMYFKVAAAATTHHATNTLNVKHPACFSSETNEI